MRTGEATAEANSVSNKRGKCMIKRDTKGLVEYRGMDVTQNCRCFSESSTRWPSACPLLYFASSIRLRFLALGEIEGSAGFKKALIVLNKGFMKGSLGPY